MCVHARTCVPMHVMHVMSVPYLRERVFMLVYTGACMCYFFVQTHPKKFYSLTVASKTNEFSQTILFSSPNSGNSVTIASWCEPL